MQRSFIAYCVVSFEKGEEGKYLCNFNKFSLIISLLFLQISHFYRHI